MKPIPWLSTVLLAGAVAWHAFWWGWVRIEPVVPAVRPDHQPLRLVLESADEPTSTQGFIRSPVLFALPYGPGFSRYLSRAEDALVRPTEEFPDLTALTPREPSGVTNQLVLTAESGLADRLDRMPPPPVSLIETPPPFVPPAGLMVSLGLDGRMDDALTGEFSSFHPSKAWSCLARLEVSASGTVGHVFLEQTTDLPVSAGARLSALLRRVAFPPGESGRLAWARLAYRPGESAP